MRGTASTEIHEDVTKEVVYADGLITCGVVATDQETVSGADRFHNKAYFQRQR